MYESIREIIDAFFEGKDSFETKSGHVWIAAHGQKRVSRKDLETIPWIEAPYFNSKEADGNHGLINEFETLTLEPKAGGQYELAVRIWSEHAWRGYHLNKTETDSHYLIGRNTRGH